MKFDKFKDVKYPQPENIWDILVALSVLNLFKLIFEKWVFAKKNEKSIIFLVSILNPSNELICVL